MIFTDYLRSFVGGDKMTRSVVSARAEGGAGLQSFIIATINPPEVAHALVTAWNEYRFPMLPITPIATVLGPGN